jgi:hypothetical protein
MVFGSVTGRDPRSLGDAECSGFELGLATGPVRTAIGASAVPLSRSRSTVLVDKAQPHPGDRLNQQRLGAGRSRWL